MILAANKVDDQRAEAEAYGLWNLGLGEPFPVSALHGRGSGDLLDAVLAALPEPPPESYAEVGGPRRVAIVGKPERRQVLAAEQAGREDRVVVDDVAGTTVDPVDELVAAGRPHLAVHRHRRHPQAGQGGLRARVLRVPAHQHRDRARRGVRGRRRRLRSRCPSRTCGSSPRSREAGRALVIAFNKWDLVDEERRYYLEREVERDLVRVQWAPRMNITARTGWHIDKLVPALDAALEGWETRVATGQLNAFLGRLVAEHPHPVRGGKQPKILFGTQAVDGAADVRAVHQRPARGVVPALHRAPAARGVRLRRQPGARAAAPAQEARAPLTLRRPATRRLRSRG